MQILNNKWCGKGFYGRELAQTKGNLKPESNMKVVSNTCKWKNWRNEVYQCNENYYKKFIWKLPKEKLF